MASLVDNIYPDHFKYLKIDIYDLPESNIIQHFDEAFKFIDEGRNEGCVFVHCNAGVSRAGSMVIGYVMRSEKMDFETAFKHVKAVRESVYPNAGFRKQLHDYKP